MEITIDKIKIDDAQDLFDFESENRAFFERMVPSRGEDYYNFETFMIRHERLLDEQIQDSSYFYLIRGRNGEILGRMNVVDIDRSQNLAHIGYRVGEKHIGQGVAHHALQTTLERLSKEGFTELFAKTTNHNIASQKVLEKNGFKKVEVSEEEFVMNEEIVWFINYRWDIT
ncbi:GNAT family N-acetyltransferase [Halobacillus litoralis]|uniref:GNAT family N-acetyltransferase n=1 Tax=Halobacillus litoralis TaxID=45668 RepID=UPI002492797B|nr:GNAT family N-acetyltransferase [Halobacillus litoralis]